MFGIRYLKTGPTQYVIHTQNGRQRRTGRGLAFFYHSPSSAIAVVPVGSADAPFIFNESTADFQPVTVQGQLTYRIAEPERVATLLDFSIDGPSGDYRSEDPDKLPQRLVNLVQVAVRSEIGRLPLQAALQVSDDLAGRVLAAVQEEPALEALGVELLTLAILAVRPSREMARALEAEAREALQGHADLAIYERRNAAVEQERRIKENELQTELAVETKKRQIREAQVEADLAVERKQQAIREAQLAGQIRLEDERRQLVAARAENTRHEADAQGYAVGAALEPLQKLDADLLQLLGLQSAEPRLMVSMALKEIAQNAAKIGQLNISPELLESLMQAGR